MRIRRAPRNPSGSALAAVAVVAVAAPFVARPAVGQEASPPSPATSAERPAEATVFSRMAPRADRARLGLFLRVDCEIEPGRDGECSTPPVVSSVVESTPAARAGIQPGDTLASIDGIPLRSERGRQALDELRAGVSVRLEVGREGGRRQIDVTPAARPWAGLFVAIEPVEGDEREVWHRVVPENAELARRLEWVHENVLDEARVRLDSLRRRQVELARRGELPPAVAAGFAYRIRSDGPSGAEARAHAPSPRRHDFRFSTIAPEDRLAGAEFRPLTPELAEYFPVDAGLLVLRVIPATPAHDLGLRGGDVVIEVGGRKTPDINVFRRLVAESLAARATIDVKWNRKGTEMTGRLPVD